MGGGGVSGRDAFKAGFLARCARDGLCREDQLLGRLAALSGVLEKRASWLDAAFKVGLLTGGAALLAPLVAGGVGGYYAARAVDVDDADVDDIKKQELLQEYRRQTERLLRTRAVRDYVQDVRQTGRVFL